MAITGRAGDIRNPVFARVYDRVLSKEGRLMRELRAGLVEGSRGRVLELGPGNGPNFALYPPAVTEVVAVEPEPYLRERAAEAAGRATVPIRVTGGVAEALPLEDDSADGVVCSLVLCSVCEPELAVREIRRVLRPGGELRLLEHVGAENRAAQAVLHAAESTFWSRAFGNCHPTRHTLAAIEAAGFDVSGVSRRVLRASAVEPPLPYITGVAR